MINDTLIPTFNRMLAFDRELDRLVSRNGKRFFVPALDVVERAMPTRSPPSCRV